MSFIPIASYLAGGGVLGFVGWLLIGIKDDFIALGIHESGTLINFLLYVFTAVFIVYWVFGGMWAVRKYNESEYNRGGL